MTLKTSATADDTKHVHSDAHDGHSDAHDGHSDAPDGHFDAHNRHSDVHDGHSAHDHSAHHSHSAHHVHDHSHSSTTTKARTNDHAGAVNTHPSHVDVEEDTEGLRGPTEPNAQGSLSHTMEKDDAKSKYPSNPRAANNSGEGRNDNQAQVVVKTGPRATA